jgi:hypothetical protein
MGRRTIDWTPNEEWLLRRMWQDPSVKTTSIAASVGKSNDAIVSKARRLGLGNRPGRSVHKRWDRSEDAALRALIHDKQTRRQAADILVGRTVHACFYRAFQLGLKASATGGSYEPSR